VDLAGIGVALAPHGDGFTITGVVAEGGAARAGLARGDVILGVDGRSVLDLGAADAIEAIRGPEGTVVTLTVRRGDRTDTLRVTRTIVRG
jgi:carboxyl-terminal processing protease